MARVSKRHATFTVDGTEYRSECSKFEITVDELDTDFLTFADAEADAKKFILAMTFAQDHAADSLWTLMNTTYSAATPEVDVLYRPYGNAVATATQPHVEGTVRVTLPSGTWMGGEADASTTAVNTVEVEWEFIAAPNLVTA